MAFAISFHGAKFLKMCGRCSSLNHRRIYSAKMNSVDIVSRIGGSLTAAGNFYSNMHLRKRGSLSLCQVNDSVGASCEGDITRYDGNSLEELWVRLHNAIQELEAVRFGNTMNQKIVNESIALQDKTVDEVCIAREAVQKATWALSLAEARLQVLMESLEAVSCDASEVEEEVVETMIWGERSVELEREATQDVKDAEADLQRALHSFLFDSQTQKSTHGQMLGENTTVHNVLSDMVDRVSSETSFEELWDQLHTAITNLKAVRFSNTMNRKVIRELIDLQEKESNVSNEVCIAREAVQKATLVLSLAEERLHVLMESAGHDASDVEDVVVETMSWGEKAVELEREATQDVKDAEAAFQRALHASLFDSQAHGQVLDVKTTVVDEDEISRGMAEKELAVDEVYTCEICTR